jgi:photosystem II stability/assembly factor-like uncharacterized protein
MMRVASYLVLSFMLALLVSGCAPEVTTPSPPTPPTATVTSAPPTATMTSAPPTATVTSAPTSTAIPSPTLGPAPIPGGVTTVALASEGEFIVTGEVDGTTGLAYFLDSAGWLHVLDGASLQVVARGQVLPSVEEGASYDLAADSGNGKVYVADGPGEETLVLDSETLSTIGRIEAYGNLAVDPVTHRLYVARVGVYVANGETGEVFDRIEGTIPEEGMETFSAVPRGVDAYVNPANRHLYVRMDNNTPGSNSRSWLDLYDADDYSLLAEQMPMPYGSSGDPGLDWEGGLDYLSGYHPITGYSRLVALDAEGRERGRLWGVGGNVFFSPRQHLVYVRHGGGWGETWLDVVDPDTMGYLDSYALNVSLHDPRNGRFYALDWQEPSVTVSDEPVVSLAPARATSAPTGPLPVDLDSLSLSPAFSSDSALFATSDVSLFTSGDGGQSWSEITLPFLNRGTMGVSFSPAYDLDKTLFVHLGCAPPGNGILRSTDGGLQWSRANSGLTDLGIEAVFFSPEYAQDRTVYASGCFDGLFKSSDGGTTWRPLTSDLVSAEGLEEGGGPSVIAAAQGGDGDLWLLTHSGVYRSEDGGETWQQADRGLEGLGLERLVLSPDYEVDKTALVTAGRGIYITRDGGEDWQVLQLPVPELWVTDLVLSPDFATDRVVFVVGFDQEGDDRLYRSSDGGLTWVASGEEFWGQWFTAITLSPRYGDDGLAFVSTDGGVYRTSDGGETWGLSDIPNIRLLAFSPAFSTDHTVFASSDQGLYRSLDGGQTWTSLQ